MAATAKTIQILDANNNNISPATNIESIYFEQLHNGVTYRTSLKNKTVIAGNLDSKFVDPTIQWRIAGENSKVDLKKVDMPFMYVNKTTSTSNIKLYQLNIASVPVGATIYEGMRDMIDELNADVSAHFLKNIGGVLDNSVGEDNYYTELKIINKKGTPANTSTFFSASQTTTCQSSQYGYGYAEYKTVNEIKAPDSSVEISEVVNTSNPKVYFVRHSTSPMTQYIYDYDKDVIMHTHSGSVLLDTSSSIAINPEGVLYLNNTEFPKPEKQSYLNFRVLQTINSTYKFVSLPLIKQQCDDGKTAQETYFSKNQQNLYLPDFVLYGTKGSPDRKDASHITIMSATPDRHITVKSLSCDTSYYSLFDWSAAGTTPQEATTIRLKLINGINVISNTLNDFDASMVLPTPRVYIQTYSKGPGNVTKSQMNDNYVYLTGTNADQANYLNYSLYDSSATCTPNVSIIWCHTLYYDPQTAALYAGQYYSNSDKRLKSDIQDINATTIPQAKQFYWNDTSIKSYGYIAQELEELGYEELVSTDDNGMKRVNYNATLSMTVEMLRKENNTLKNKISSLEDKLNKILDKLYKN